MYPSRRTHPYATLPHKTSALTLQFWPLPDDQLLILTNGYHSTSIMGLGLGFQPLADSTRHNTSPLVRPYELPQAPSFVEPLVHAQECSRAALHAQPMAQHELEREEERGAPHRPPCCSCHRHCRCVARAGVLPGRQSTEKAGKGRHCAPAIVAIVGIAVIAAT